MTASLLGDHVVIDELARRRHGRPRANLRRGVAPLLDRPGSLAGQHLVQNAGERELIGATIDVHGARLLGRHVCGRPVELWRLGGLDDARRDAEVEQFRELGAILVANDHDVGGLQVAVRDAHIVHCRQRARCVEDEVDGDARFDRRALLDDMRKRNTLEVLHDEVVPEGVAAIEVGDKDDMFVTEQARQARLLTKARDPGVVVRKARVHDLHGEALVEQRVSHQVHPTKLPLPELAFDDVATIDELTGTRQRHAHLVLHGILLGATLWPRAKREPQVRALVLFSVLIAW